MTAISVQKTSMISDNHNFYPVKKDISRVKKNTPSRKLWSGFDLILNVGVT